MIIKPIKTEEDHNIALERVKQLMDATPGSPESDELEILSALIENYEDKHFPIELPDVASAIRFRLDQLGINQADLAKLLEISTGRVSEYLSGKRKISRKDIGLLHNKMNIPLEVFFNEEHTSLQSKPYFSNQAKSVYGSRHSDQNTEHRAG